MYWKTNACNGSVSGRRIDRPGTSYILVPESSQGMTAHVHSYHGQDESEKHLIGGYHKVSVANVQALRLLRISVDVY